MLFCHSFVGFCASKIFANWFVTAGSRRAAIAEGDDGVQLPSDSCNAVGHCNRRPSAQRTCLGTQLQVNTSLHLVVNNK